MRIFRLIRTAGLRGFNPDGERKGLNPETRRAARAYQPSVMRDNGYAGKIAMNDALSAAVIGAIAGYLIARHSAEIEWLVHALIG